MIVWIETYGEVSLVFRTAEECEGPCLSVDVTDEQGERWLAATDAILAAQVEIARLYR